jgi:two-component system cell cycle response regulator
VTDNGTQDESDPLDAYAIGMLVDRQAEADPDLALHGQAVGRLAAATGSELGLDPTRTAELRVAGELHDIGKLLIPQSILHKPGPLDDHEWAEVRAHPVIGGRMIRGVGLGRIANWVFDHHERPDGQGYPCGIRAISLEARILAVADAYDAMTTDRPYPAPVSHPEAVEELYVNAGSQFDHSVVSALVSGVEELLGAVRSCDPRKLRT